MRRISPRYLLLVAGVASAVALPTAARAATLAQWDFDQGTPGVGFHFDVNPTLSGIPVPDVSGNGNTMFGFNNIFSPHYSNVGDTPTGVGLSSIHNGSQDGFLHPCCSAALNAWEPEQWTIETAVKLDVVSAFRTFITRDGGSFPPASDFYLQTNIDSRVRVDFGTVAGSRVEVLSNFIPTPGEWFRVAATSDNTTASLWIDQLDGNGYQLAGTTAIPGATAADRALASVGANWVFGRGWFDNGFGDQITGNLDDIRFSDVALGPGQFLIPEPATWSMLALAGAALSFRARKNRNR